MDSLAVIIMTVTVMTAWMCVRSDLIKYLEGCDLGTK